MKKHCAEQIDTLWDEVKRFDNPHNYYVDLSQKLYDTLTGIQWGRLPDEFGWTVKVD